MKKYEDEFLHPPREYTQIPFWFLNGKVDGAEYVRQIDEMADKGVFQAMPHPRFGMDRRDYLTAKYWNAFEQLLSHAREKDFIIHLYDEYNWSSGPAGGKVTSEAKNCALGLGMRSKTVDGPSNVEIDGWCDGLHGWGKKEKWIGIAIAPSEGAGRISMDRLEWLMVMQEDLIPGVYENAPSGGDSSVEQPGTATVTAHLGSSTVSAHLPDNPHDAVRVEVPEGHWEVMVFYTIRTLHPSPLRMGNGGIIDYLSPHPTSEFIRHTHEKYSKHLGEYFGDTISTIFYDESGPYASGPFTWTEKFPELFENAKGYDIIPLLPLLFYDGGELTEKVRCDYWDMVSELFVKNHIGQMDGWCRKNGITLTGHTYEEPDRWMMAGDPMRTLRCQGLAGIDSLTGYKNYHLLKIGASIPDITDNTGLLCEALGIMDLWQASPRRMKQAYNQLAIIGVTHMVPHAFFQTIDNPKVECPPSFFEHNAYWKYYRVIADITARQCWINAQGNHLADIAILFPLVSWWGDSKGGRGYGFPWEVAYEDERAKQDRRCFEEIINLMMKNQMDLTVIDSDALRSSEIDGCELKAGHGSYKFLIIPPMNTIRLSDMQKIHDFGINGGKIIFAGKWPIASMENGRNDECLEEYKNQLKDKVSFADTVADIIKFIRNHAVPDVTILEGCRLSIDICHRTVGLNHVYAVSNISDNYQTIKLQFREKGRISIWYPETGKSCSLTSKETDNGTITEIRLEPFELVYIVFDRENKDEWPITPIPAYKLKVPDCTEAVEGKWNFMPVDMEEGNTWRCDHKNGFIKVPVMKKLEKGWQDGGTYDGFWEKWYKPDFDDTAWETVHCLRGPVKSDNTVSILLRLPIPAGVKGVRLPLPVSGEHAVYANGKCLGVILDHKDEYNVGLKVPAVSDTAGGNYAAGGMNFEAPGNSVQIFDEGIIAETICNKGVLAIESASMAPDNGLLKPVEFYTEPVEIGLTSWKNLGLWWHSGFGYYRKTINVSRTEYSALLIDLGEVRECAEVWVNGKSAGVRLWPPYRMDITDLARPGENEVVVIVSNLLSNRFSWDVWGTRCGGEVLDSGLLGPVSLEFYD